MAFTSKMANLTPCRLQLQEKIALLSGGYVKPDAFPNGEITVYPWDSTTDDWLAERMRKGDKNTVLFDMCERLCNLNGCPLDSFLVGDVYTVIFVSRAMRYGGEVEFEYTCPNPACGYTARDTLKIPQQLGRVGEKSAAYPGYDTITLPICGDVVQIRPLQVKDEKLILGRDELSAQLMTERVMRILMPVVSINEGKPDAWEDIVRWYHALHPSDAETLDTKEKENSPHLDTDIPYLCDRCQRKFKHSLDFSTEFFRASLKPGRGTSVAPDVRSGLELKGANREP